MENPFVKLFAIDFKDHLEVKKSGSTELKIFPATDNDRLHRELLPLLQI